MSRPGQLELILQEMLSNALLDFKCNYPSITVVIPLYIKGQTFSQAAARPQKVQHSEGRGEKGAFVCPTQTVGYAGAKEIPAELRAAPGGLEFMPASLLLPMGCAAFYNSRNPEHRSGSSITIHRKHWGGRGGTHTVAHVSPELPLLLQNPVPVPCNMCRACYGAPNLAGKMCFPGAEVSGKTPVDPSWVDQVH